MSIKRLLLRIIFFCIHVLYGRPSNLLLKHWQISYGKVIWRIFGDLYVGTGIEIYGGYVGNLISQGKPSIIVVEAGGRLRIEDNVKASSINIYVKESIYIGKNAMFGSGVSIWDSDFHSMNVIDRIYGNDKAKSSPIFIGDDVFIGANCLILKGVRIGEGAIIGANSVVTKSVGSKEIWAGNPARKIR